MAIEILIEVPEAQPAIDGTAQPILGQAELAGQNADGETFLAVEPVDRHQPVERGQQRRIGGLTVGGTAASGDGRATDDGTGEHRLEVGMQEKHRNDGGDRGERSGIEDMKHRRHLRRRRRTSSTATVTAMCRAAAAIR